jgi:hypothetical protein
LQENWFFSAFVVEKGIGNNTQTHKEKNFIKKLKKIFNFRKKYFKTTKILQRFKIKKIPTLY